jgi:hypothetical protein
MVNSSRPPLGASIVAAEVEVLHLTGDFHRKVLHVVTRSLRNPADPGAHRLPEKSARFWPFAAMTPIPVMTTRRVGFALGVRYHL